MSDKIIKANNVIVSDSLTPSHQRLLNRDEQVLRGVVSSQETPASREQRHRQETEANALEHARKEVYDQGFSEGIAWQKQQNLLSVKALEGIIRETECLKKKLYAGAEEQMLNLVLAVAEKVIYDEVSANRKTILAVLREAVKGVMDREGMNIRLNPIDYDFIKELKPDLFMGLDGARNIAFEADTAIQPGGALLQTNAGEVDARLDQRVNEIKAALNIN